MLYHISNMAEKHAAYEIRRAKLVEAAKPELDRLSQMVTASWTEINNWIKVRAARLRSFL